MTIDPCKLQLANERISEHITSPLKTLSIISPTRRLLLLLLTAVLNVVSESICKLTYMDRRLSSDQVLQHNRYVCLLGWTRLAQCDFRFDLFFSFSFSFANNQIISNLLTKTC